MVAKGDDRNRKLIQRVRYYKKKTHCARHGRLQRTKRPNVGGDLNTRRTRTVFCIDRRCLRVNSILTIRKLQLRDFSPWLAPRYYDLFGGQNNITGEIWTHFINISDVVERILQNVGHCHNVPMPTMHTSVDRSTRRLIQTVVYGGSGDRVPERTCSIRFGKALISSVRCVH